MPGRRPPPMAVVEALARTRPPCYDPGRSALESARRRPRPGALPDRPAASTPVRRPDGGMAYSISPIRGGRWRSSSTVGGPRRPVRVHAGSVARQTLDAASAGASSGSPGPRATPPCAPPSSPAMLAPCPARAPPDVVPVDDRPPFGPRSTTRSAGRGRSSMTDRPRSAPPVGGVRRRCRRGSRRRRGRWRRRPR